MKIRNRYTDKVILEVPGETLEGADLRGADLKDAFFWGANLRGANLRNADLQGAYLWHANLQGAGLQDANLQGANIQGANIQGANLRDANLEGANLWHANLQNANLQDVDLRDANLRDAKLSNYSICPEVGSFIGYKKASGQVVKLEIPIEAKRVSTPTSKKCRAEFVRVLSISNGLTRVESDQGNVIYRVGDLAYPDSFSDDIRECCTHGIHFFMTEQEAEEWQ